MAVDTEKQHYECRKCKDVISLSDYQSNKNNKCVKGGTCDWKHQQVSWNKSALGATVNLITGSGKKPMTEDEKIVKLERERIETELAQKNAELAKHQKEKNATMILKMLNYVKPYLKYIIPAYLVAFGITMFVVDKKNYVFVFLIYAIPLAVIIWAFFNKPKNV